jgi:hypothetical protein
LFLLVLKEVGQLFNRQGQCKPNAESSLYAEVQPVLAISIAKLGIKKECLANSQTPMSHFMSLMSRFMSPWSFE